MDYYSKYLKYKNKYILLRNNINKGGAPFPDEDPAFRHAIEESMKSSEEDDNARQVLRETRNTNFLQRVEQATILVIGASIDYESDITRWSQIDPFFIGVSMHGDDPISDLGNWNDDENYWINVFDILGNRKFDSIYIDRGTVHHMAASTGFHYRDATGTQKWIKNSEPVDISQSVYAKLIKFIDEKDITQKLYIHDDALSTTTIKVYPLIDPVRYNHDDETVAKIYDHVYKIESEKIKDKRKHM